MLFCLQLRSLSRGIPSSHLEKEERLILGHICIYLWKRHAFCYVVFGFARNPWLNMFYGIVWETKYGRFTALNIPKCEHFTLLACPLRFLVIFAMRQLGNVQSFKTQVSLFHRYVFSLLTKMRTGTKLFPRLNIFSTFRGVHALIFTYVLYIVIGLHEEPANFYRKKRSVAFVTGHLFTFLVVLSLICLVTTQIFICENQTIWRLEILWRTIVAALLKTEDIKKGARNISQ